MDVMITIPNESVLPLEQEGELIIDEIILDGYLYRRVTNRPVMHVNKTDLLKNPEDHVMIIREMCTKPDRAVETGCIDHALYEILRKERLLIAKEENVSAYFICNNSTLVDMCTKLPTDKTTMLDVKGIGQTKYDKYGDRFIRVIDDYLKGIYDNDEAE